MTKEKDISKMETTTLTEQWKNGTLPLNHYYVKTKSGRYGINHTVLSFDGDKPRTRLEYSDRTEEVLATVPTYDEWVHNELLKKVEKLEKLLKECKSVIEQCVRSDYIEELKERIDEVLK